MFIGDVFKTFNTMIKKEDLKNISILNNTNKRNEIIDKLKVVIPDYDEIKKGIAFLGENEDDFYFVEESQLGTLPFFYFKNDSLISIYSFEIKGLELLNIKKIIKESHLVLENLKEKKDFNTFFALVNERISFELYKKHFREIPDNQKYEIFKSLYVSVDYGFELFNTSLISEVFKTYNNSGAIKELRKSIKINKDDKIKIYRGAGKYSRDTNEAYSWTISKQIALYFATRFHDEGKVYEAEINICDVIDYILDRNEFEVLVMPSSILNIKEMKFYKISEILPYLESAGVISKYRDSVNTDEFEDVFIREGIHGISHAKRVVFLALTLAYLDGLNEIDTNILLYAAMYHDIGRENDNKCDIHGKLSYEKALKDGLIFECNDDDSKILKFIIENHCIDDNVALLTLKESDIKDKKRAKFLYNYLCDADSLDRVRVKDLNDKYLRNETSKKLMFLAHQLLHGIK